MRLDHLLSKELAAPCSCVFTRVVVVAPVVTVRVARGLLMGGTLIVRAGCVCPVWWGRSAVGALLGPEGTRVSGLSWCGIIVVSTSACPSGWVLVVLWRWLPCVV